MESTKHETLNSKWFDGLTILSEVEGQIQMTKIQNLKQGVFFTVRYPMENIWYLDFDIVSAVRCPVENFGFRNSDLITYLFRT